MSQQPSQQPTQANVPRGLLGRKGKLYTWRGTPADLMAIASRTRELMKTPRERALAQREAQIGVFFDQQIEGARRTQPAEQLGSAIDSLMKAKADAKAKAAEEIVGVTGYAEAYSITLENDRVEIGEAEHLFSPEGFPRVKAVNMVVRSQIPNAQIQVALANANPYVPQLEANIGGDDPGWVDGSLRSMQEILERGQTFPLKHWHCWIRPIVLPILTWAFFSWLLAALVGFYRIPVLLKYPWLAIFPGALPTAGVFWLLQRAIPPFGVYRAGEGYLPEAVRGLIIVVIGAALLWLLGRFGLWLVAHTL